MWKSVILTPITLILTIGGAQKVTLMSSPITGKYNGIGIPTVLYVKEINGNSYRNLTY